jgi:hypothetical protein
MLAYIHNFYKLYRVQKKVLPFVISMGLNFIDYILLCQEDNKNILE